MPLFLKSRFYEFNEFDWNNYFVKNWLIVVYSIIIGAFSHLLWDSFTHINSDILDYSFAFLTDHLSVFGFKIHVYSLFQYISSIFGILFILFFIWKLPVNKDTPSDTDKKYWFLSILLTVTVMIIRYYSNPKILLVKNPLGNVIVTCVTSFVISLILAPIILSFKSKKTN